MRIPIGFKKRSLITQFSSRVSRRIIARRSIASMRYPTARRDESAGDTYFETKVPDPYRWLEDPDSKETEDFVDAQNEVTGTYLSAFKQHSELKERIKGIYSYERFSAPNRKGDGKWYWSYNPGLLDQSQIWRASTYDLTEASPELFFDANKLSEDGTVSLGATAFSESGRYFAYAISQSGSDQQTIYVRETEGSSDPSIRLSDTIKYVKFSSTEWLHDDSGFLYCRYPVGDTSGTATLADENQQLYFHKLGTAQDEDVLIKENKAEPKNMFGAEVTNDGRFILLYETRDCDPECRLSFIDLSLGENTLTPKSTIKVVVDEFRASYTYIANVGTRVLFRSNQNAPRNKIVEIDLAKPEAGFKDLIRESPTDVLDSAVCVRNNLMALTYTHDVKDQVSIWNFDGAREDQLALPIGAVHYVGCRHDSKEMFVAFGTYTSPVTLYQYRFNSEKNQGTLEIYRKTEVAGVDPADYVSNQVFYKSKDGTEIPMFITHRKGLDVSKSSPVILYAYGGFEISIPPSYSPTWMTWMKHFDGVLAVANIRGGGEYGKEWHQAAIKQKRQNAFDDFQYAAGYLIDRGYTSPQHLSISGGSNGGLLCGVCLNQAPELYGAVVSEVGVHDMLRFHKFTIGSHWVSDYGNPDESREMFEYIKNYSPLHNVSSDKPYPATLLMTADHDDRVIPAHTLKFMAELQSKKPDNPTPLLVRVDKKAGHGAGKPTSLKIEEVTAKLAFLSLALKVPLKTPNHRL